MEKKKLVRIVSMLMVIVFLLSACGPTPSAPDASLAPPSRCAEVAPGSWDCSQDGRKVIVSDLPTDVTPYFYAFDKDALMALPKDDKISRIVSVVADIRFYKNEDKNLRTPIPTFEKGITIIMGISPKDRDLVGSEGLPKLFPIQTTTKVDHWKLFPVGSYTMNRDTFEVEIKTTNWGDPPIGWGT
jgi:hypothetical protein